MSLKRYEFGLDLVSDSLTPLILARVTEKNAVTTIVQITNNGAVIPDFGEYTPVFECRLPGGYFVRDDGSTYDNMEIIDPVKGIIQYTMAKEVFARNGRLNLCYFVLEKGGTAGFQILQELDLSADERVTTPNFTINVAEDATQGNIQLEDFISDIDRLNNFIRESTAEAMETLNTAIAQLNESTVTANQLIQLINTNQLLKLTGGTMIGSLGFDVSKPSSVPVFDLSNTTSTQSWARGIGYRLGTAGNRVAEFGISGLGQEAKSIYFGFGVSPWLKDNSFFVESETKKAFIFNKELETTAGAQVKADAAKTAAIAYVDAKFSDSGWLDLPLKTNYSAGTAKPQYRKIGNVVYIRGLLVRVAGTAAGAFSTLPVGFRTSTNYVNGYKTAQQSSAVGSSATIYVKPNGDMEVLAIAVDTSSIWLDGIFFLTD
ncbi:BppU family phage baseplate upper protein [Listeria newyorkensis]|uniref:BppU family phage baseplate upper protein n=1 Tax=Listeria newyorkensis TaxID=1497681 RepID=A0A841Z083_9LIST|nr:BppU family phage baseplate upper protein [Listeria newyorkensis]MBC1459080.1 BppU family phage baseplate upper protein [Listeria newyorkensis]